VNCPICKEPMMETEMAHGIVYHCDRHKGAVTIWKPKIEKK